MKAEMKIKLKKTILSRRPWRSKEYRGPVHSWKIYLANLNYSRIILVGLSHPPSFLYWCTFMLLQVVHHHQLWHSSVVFSCVYVREWDDLSICMGLSVLIALPSFSTMMVWIHLEQAVRPLSFPLHFPHASSIWCYQRLLANQMGWTWAVIIWICVSQCQREKY